MYLANKWRNVSATNRFQPKFFAFSASSASRSKTHKHCSPLPLFNRFGGKSPLWPFNNQHYVKALKIQWCQWKKAKSKLTYRDNCGLI